MYTKSLVLPKRYRYVPFLSSSYLFTSCLQCLFICLLFLSLLFPPHPHSHSHTVTLTHTNSLSLSLSLLFSPLFLSLLTCSLTHTYTHITHSHIDPHALNFSCSLSPPFCFPELLFQLIRYTLFGRAQTQEMFTFLFMKATAEGVFAVRGGRE